MPGSDQQHAGIWIGQWQFHNLRASWLQLECFNCLELDSHQQQRQRLTNRRLSPWTRTAAPVRAPDDQRGGQTFTVNHPESLAHMH